VGGPNYFRNHEVFNLNLESFLSESNKVVKALMVGGFEAYIYLRRLSSALQRFQKINK
jgi:hypothetical protein